MKKLNKNEANQCSEEENIENMKKIQEAFDCFDKNKSGRIPTRVMFYIHFNKQGIRRRLLDIR